MHTFAMPDILGEDFSQQRFEMGRDYSGEVCSTLVRRIPIIESKRAVLYIHGYNDYFFQSEMANRFYDSGYNFYAVDLRRYGRSLMPNQRPFEVRDLSEYFEDIEAALRTIRSEGAEEIILMGHSTGGLIASLYCKRHEAAPRVEGLILNSPFLDMNFGWFMESVVAPIAALIGRWRPDWTLSEGDEKPSAYYESLHIEQRGEWSYDTSLKSKGGQPIQFGWLNAIYQGHREIQEGANISIPILLLYSDNSVTQSDWTPAHQSGDSVLDVADIAKYGDRLSRNVTHGVIEGGMHDLALSNPRAREKFYHTIFEWLKENGL